MSRIRQSLLRRPALLLSWVLLALTSQALAVTLDWCLHGEEVHVELAATPCHGEAPVSTHEHCPDADQPLTADAGTGPGIMFSAAIDAAVMAALVPDFQAVPAFIVYLPAAADPPAASAWLASRTRSSLTEHSPSAGIPGVLAGTSTRLLI